MKALLLAASTLAAVACATEPSAVIVREHAIGTEGDTPAPDAMHPLLSADEGTTTTTVRATTTTTEAEPVTTTAVAPRRTTTTEAWEPPAPQGRTTGRGDEPAGNDAPLACIRSYESGGNYGAVSPSGQYRGAYQFDRQTWGSVGGSGDPADASPAEQDMRAQMLYDRRGLAPWPTPNRMCG